MKQARKIAVFAGLTACVVLSGCSKTTSQRAAVKANPSPALDSLSQREVDIQNSMTVASDENLRMISSDLGRFLLLDRPSHLTVRADPAPLSRVVHRTI